MSNKEEIGPERWINMYRGHQERGTTSVHHCRVTVKVWGISATDVGDREY